MATYFTSTDNTRQIEVPMDTPYVLVRREDDEVLATGKTRSALVEAMSILGVTKDTVRVAATYGDYVAPTYTGPSLNDLIRLAVARESLNGRRR